MHALQPLPPNLQPTRRSRKRPRTYAQARSQRHPHRLLAIETTVKLVVNVGISAAAVLALTHLLPYRSTQEVKLQELQAAVKSTDDRVQQTQLSFSRFFDPTQTKVLMQEQTNRIDPSQSQLVLQAPGTLPTAPATP